MTKEYDSIFSPKKKICIAGHITELIINNKIDWVSKKQGVDKKPRCDFWSKEKAESNADFKQLQKDFSLEISYIKNLLKVFSAPVIVKYVKDRGIITFRYLTLDKQKTVMYNLFQEQIKHIKSVKESTKKKKEPQKELEFKSRGERKTGLTDLL